MAIKAKGIAPGQYLGYALQPVRLFYHLLTCNSEASVGLEHSDDISVHNGPTTLIVEQCKSALSHNPVSDWSSDLWKTFANWIENVNSGVFDPQTTKFHLYVTPPKKGKLVESLSSAASETEIAKILDGVRTKLEKRKTPPACDAYIKTVLTADLKLLIVIVRNFSLIQGDENPLAPIYAHLDATVSNHVIETACQYGIGHAKELVDRLIQRGEDPVISARAFRKSFKAFVAKYDAANILHSLSDAPSDEVIQDIISKAPAFVAQLELVEADSEIKTRAASDFLRSSADRTDWADQGTVFEDSMIEYDNALKKRHKHLQGEVEILSAHLPEAKRGLLLYHRCCTVAPIPLQGRVIPDYFMTGSLNTISDRLEIGWHPNYARLLQTMEMEDA